MSAEPNATSRTQKTPWHLWAIGVLALLWNASGAVTIMLSLVAIIVTDISDLLNPDSPILASTGAMVVTGLIFILAILQLVYATAMRKRAVLR